MWLMYVFLGLPLTLILTSILCIPAYIAQAKKHPFRRVIWISCIASGVIYVVGVNLLGNPEVSQWIPIVMNVLFVPLGALVWVLIPIKKAN